MLEGIFICINVTAWFVQSLKFFSILQESEGKEINVSKSYLVINKKQLKKNREEKNKVYFEGITYIISRPCNLNLLPVCYNLALGYTCS